VGVGIFILRGEKKKEHQGKRDFNAEAAEVGAQSSLRRRQPKRKEGINTEGTEGRHRVRRERLPSVAKAGFVAGSNAGALRDSG